MKYYTHIILKDGTPFCVYVFQDLKSAETETAKFNADPDFKDYYMSITEGD